MKPNKDVIEKQMHEQADEYFINVLMTESERKVFHLGVEFGAKWVDYVINNTSFQT